MMKTKIVMMVGLLLAAVAAPYFMKGPDGQPLMNLLPEVDSQLSTEETRQTFYKWQDEKGQWHFGDDVPQGAKTVAVDVDTAANVLQSVKVPVKEEVAPKKRAAEPVAPAIPGLPMTVDPTEIPKLIDDAKNVQSLVDDRSKQLQQIR